MGSLSVNRKVNPLVLIFWILVISFTVQVIYLLAASRLPAHVDPVCLDGPKVSVIVCAHNELANLKAHLPHLLEQEYSDFEVIVVDHGSTDGTDKWLATISDPRFSSLFVPRDKQGKKFALREGIEKAKYEVILLTDADCEPASRQWINGMACGFVDDTNIVLGYGAYKSRPGWLNRFIRMETVDTAIRYLTFANLGSPFMGVGRNLAYTKELFMGSDRFDSHEHLAGGDDDLFVNRYAQSSQTAFVLDQSTFTYSEPVLFWREWIQQKKRHITAGIMYRGVHKFLLGLLAVSHYMFYVCFALLMVYEWEPRMVLNLFMIRLVLQWIVYIRVITQLKERGLWWFIPVFDLVYLFIQLRWVFGMTKHNKTSWN